MKNIIVITWIALFASSAYAQTWPSKPVKFFVAGAPGSAPDIIARLVGERLTRIWGEQVIVDNRVGAAGNIGTQAAARAPADGHNFLFGQAAPLALNQHTFKSMPFDVERDFVPVVSMGLSPMMVAVNPALPAKTLPELIALAKADPGKVSFATSGAKNIPHLTGELINQRAGVKMFHIPYKIGSQGSADTVSGQVQVYIDGVPPVSVHMKGERLRVLAVSSARRLPNFPDIPAVAETLPGYSFGGWFAIMAPAGTSPEVLARVNRDVNTVIRQPDIAERLLQFGIYEPGGTPEQLAQFIKSERENYGNAVRAAGILPE